jgi:hypothetical protein
MPNRDDENFILEDQDFAGNSQCEKFMGLVAKSMFQFAHRIRSVVPVGIDAPLFDHFVTSDRALKSPRSGQKWSSNLGGCRTPDPLHSPPQKNKQTQDTTTVI